MSYTYIYNIHHTFYILQQYNFSLMDATCWECFLPPPDSSHDKNDTPGHLVVMPNSWVNVLEVPRNSRYAINFLKLVLFRY